MEKQDKDYLEMQAEQFKVLMFDGQGYINTIIGYASLLEHDLLNNEEKFSPAEKTEFVKTIKESAIRYQDLMDGCVDQLRDYHKKSRGE